MKGGNYIIFGFRELSELVDFHKHDIPSPELVDQEVYIKYSSLSVEERPETCAKSIKECDASIFMCSYKYPEPYMLSHVIVREVIVLSDG